MNLHANFLQLWSNKFPCCMDSLPQLECLKADQFLTVNEQRVALEVAQSEISASIDRLQTTLSQQFFISDYLRTCITKLSAVSRVFNELENGDEHSAEELSSLKLDEQQTPPQSEPTNTSVSALNLSVPSPSQTPSLSLIPSFFNSPSQLIPATSRNLLLHSALSSQTVKPDSMPAKSDPQPVTQRPSPATMEEAVRCMVNDMSGTPSKTGNNHQHQYHPNHQQGRQPSSHIPPPSHPPHPLSEDFPTNTFNAARAAAAAVSAALGFHFPPPDMFNLNPPPQPPPPPKNSGASSSPDLQTVKGNSEDYATRPYRCSTCGRGFAVKAGLMQHLRTHTDERPYPCPECGRAFKQKIQLTTHMRVHSGERPYGCRICGKLFRQQSHVVQHLRTHTGEKPHKCTRCNKAFRQKYSLISHQRRMCQSRSSSSSALMAGMTMWIGPGGRAAEKAAAAAAVAQNRLRSSHSPTLPLLPHSVNSAASPLPLSFPPPPLTSTETNASPSAPPRTDDRSSCSPSSSHGGGSINSFRQPSPHSKNSPSNGFNSAASSAGRSFHENDYSMATSSSSYPSPYHSEATDLRLNSGGGFQSRIEESSAAAVETAGV